MSLNMNTPAIRLMIRFDSMIRFILFDDHPSSVIRLIRPYLPSAVPCPFLPSLRLHPFKVCRVPVGATTWCQFLPAGRNIHSISISFASLACHVRSYDHTYESRSSRS
mmetsp:Transcript_26485/g.53803  ORF Transcript_26485/g.53803 Transcript_26485/m.53803 type:complete len:108 (+) Transcript_26485:95-418(+)